MPCYKLILYIYLMYILLTQIIFMDNSNLEWHCFRVFRVCIYLSKLKCYSLLKLSSKIIGEICKTPTSTIYEQQHKIDIIHKISSNKKSKQYVCIRITIKRSQCSQFKFNTFHVIILSLNYYIKMQQ